MMIFLTNMGSPFIACCTVNYFSWRKLPVKDNVLSQQRRFLVQQVSEGVGSVGSVVVSAEEGLWCSSYVRVWLG